MSDPVLLGKIKKNIIGLLSAESAHSMVTINGHYILAVYEKFREHDCSFHCTITIIVTYDFRANNNQCNLCMFSGS